MTKIFYPRSYSGRYGKTKHCPDNTFVGRIVNKYLRITSICQTFCDILSGREPLSEKDIVQDGMLTLRYLVFSPLFHKFQHYFLPFNLYDRSPTHSLFFLNVFATFCTKRNDIFTFLSRNEF